MTRILATAVFILAGSGLAQAQAKELSDQSFINQAAKGIQARIDISTVHLMRSGSQELNEFSSDLGEDLQEDRAELMALAKKLNLQWPDDINARSREPVSEMTDRRTYQVDEKAVNALRQSLQTDLALYERAESSESLDPALRQWAADEADDLRDDAKELKGLAKSL
jgi:predicted outer membrane protein